MPRYDKQARSPYHRYGKAPYKYSDAYARWSRLTRAFADPDEIAAADFAFRRLHHVPLRFTEKGEPIYA